MTNKNLNVGARFIASIFIAVLLLFAAPAWSTGRIERVDSRFGCTVGENVAEGDVLMMKSTGVCWKADADDATLRPAIGVAGFAAKTGTGVSVVTRGQVGGMSALTKGAGMWLHTTAGGLTQSTPSAYYQAVGAAISATQYVLNVQNPADSAARSVAIALPDPGAADADLATYVLWSPSVDATITKIYHVPHAAWVAAVAANDGVVVVTNAAVGAVATLPVVTALAAGTKNDMGAITNAAVVANTNVTLTITANGTANAPPSTILIEYVPTRGN